MSTYMGNSYKSILILLVSSILVFSACDEPVFIFDPGMPGLPVFSKRGNDVAGAIINNTMIWNSMNYSSTIPVQCDTINNKLRLYFEGYLVNEDNHNNDDIYLIMEIETDKVKSFDDLVALDQTKYDFTSPGNLAYIVIDENNYDENFQPLNQKGNLTIRRSSSTGTNSDKIIFAGTFGYEYEDSFNLKYTVFQGRFDFTIRESGFYYKQ
ncbi:hypothetical protein [Marinigracilibium pacificum]|uniref:Uncharacterized protein n=1 Tax=Marinigracilibium pacificum TaxID=2729599 RepID=A0A848IW42_9BACT|nr:hypothetical protein [Marinigracilibium pacificum]NMM47495.1 hypothetical protein [Marinigracilibium pacificum]